MSTLHHGKILKNYLTIHNIALVDFAKMTGKSRQMIYVWMRQKNFKYETVELFRIKANIPPGTFKSEEMMDIIGKSQQISESKLVKELREEIRSLKIEFSQKEIQYLKQINALLKDKRK